MFCDILGELRAMAIKFKEAFEQCGPSIQEATLVDRVRCMGVAAECLKELPAARDKLRNGGTVRMEQDILDTLSDFWEHLDRRTNAEAELLAKMETVVGYLDTSTNVKGDKLKQDISTQMLVWEKSLQLGGLRHFSQQPLTTAKVMQDFVTKLKATESVEKPPDLLDALQTSYKNGLRQLEVIIGQTSFENAGISITGDGSDESVESCVDLLKALAFAAYDVDNPGHKEEVELITNTALDVQAWCVMILVISPTTIALLGI